MTPRRVFRMRCQVTPQAGHARCPGQTARTITSGLRAGRTRSCAMPGGKASAPGRTPASMPCVAAWTRSAFRSPNAGGPNARPNCRISRIGPEPGLTANQPPSQIAAQGRKIARWSAPWTPLNGSQRRSGRVEFSAESPFLLDFERFGPNPGRSGRAIRLCLVPSSGKQAGNGNVLVQFRPVDAPAAELVGVARFRRCVEQAGEPRQRHTDGAAVAEVDPHAVGIETEGFRRNAHATHLQAFPCFAQQVCGCG